MTADRAGHRCDLSLIVPLFNEGAGLDVFFARIVPILQSITGNFEIVCVNDGSRDDTLPRLKAWHQRDSRIKIVDFSRNFGKELALTAGLDYSNGAAVIPIDADLQDPPELIPELVVQWRAGYKVVLATRRSRPGDSWLKAKSAAWFYRAINTISTVRIPHNTGDFRLMDREVVEAVRRMPERVRFMKGLFAWVGFSTTTVYFDRAPRHAGTSSWNFWKLWKFALDGFFTFSTMPLHIWSYLGGLISLCSFFYAAWLIVRSFLFGIDVPGYTSIMVVMLFLGGVQLLSLGIIGEYVGRIYRESKRRPLYLVQETIGIG